MNTAIVASRGIIGRFQILNLKSAASAILWPLQGQRVFYWKTQAKAWAMLSCPFGAWNPAEPGSYQFSSFVVVLIVGPKLFIEPGTKAFFRLVIDL
jgi:hypothetical protein